MWNPMSVHPPRDGSKLLFATINGDELEDLTEWRWVGGRWDTNALPDFHPTHWALSPTPDRSGEADKTGTGLAEGESGLPEGSSK